MSYLITIEKIKGKAVTFLKMNHLKEFGDFVNAYVLIEKADASKDYQFIAPHVTYQRGKVLGIDTAHSWNEKQTYEERYEDAKIQIEYVIEYFKNKRRNKYGNKSNR